MEMQTLLIFVKPHMHTWVHFTVAANHLHGPHRESPKAMSKLSQVVVYPKKNTHLTIHTNLVHF